MICTHECRQGHACTCVASQTELALDIAPDDQRVIQPPITTPDDRAAIAHARRWAIALAVLCFAALAGLLRLFGAQTL